MKKLPISIQKKQKQLPEEFEHLKVTDLALSLSKDLIAQSKRISFFDEFAIFWFDFTQRYNLY